MQALRFQLRSSEFWDSVAVYPTIYVFNSPINTWALTHRSTSKFRGEFLKSWATTDDLTPKAEIRVRAYMVARNRDGSVMLSDDAWLVYYRENSLLHPTLLMRCQILREEWDVVAPRYAESYHAHSSTNRLL